MKKNRILFILRLAIALILIQTLRFKFTAHPDSVYIFEAVGLEVTLLQALEALKKGGRAVLVGLFEEAKISLPANIFVQKEISLVGSQGYNWDFQDSLALLKQGTIQLKPLITHEFPLDQTQEAFDLLMDPDNQAVKIVIKVT